jgi:hypothetical protein
MHPEASTPATHQTATQAALQCLAEGRLQQALVHAQQAAAMAPSDPMMHNNLGAVLHALGLHGPSLEAHARALQLNPLMLHSLVNRAAPLRDSGQVQAAQHSLEQAVQAYPESLAARWNLALLLLAQGHYAQAWPLFECRWEPGGHCAPLRRPNQPSLWRGDAHGLAGKCLLVQAEQGLGDALQTVRFVPDLLRHGVRVVLEVQPTLLRLMKNTWGNLVTVVPMSPMPPSADFSVGVMGLAGICGLQTPQELAMAGAPGAAVPYLNAVPPSVLQAWAQRLGPKRRPRVGLMWGGNPHHAQNRRRSVPLPMLLDTLAQQWGDRVELLSLQKDLSPEDEALLQRHPELRHWGAEQADLLDAAALCQLCDAVLTVDTSMAHLAGALGLPTWVMLHASADWRWGLSGATTPWYPSLRLVRQSTWGEWQQVLEQATLDMAADMRLA